MNRRIRLLLVDDETGITEGLQILLKCMEKPWEIVGSAEDGKKAIELVKTTNPDIVITDIRMPVMDGLEMVRCLKEENTSCRFIMLSGYRDFEYARQAMSLGVRHYVTKPIDEDELAKAIDQLSEEVGILENPAMHVDPIDEILNYIKERCTQNLSLSDLSAIFFRNPYYIGQLIKKKTGHTFQNYVTGLRMELAKKYLIQSDLMVYEISEKVGYNDTTYFSRMFEKTIGVRPSEYRKGDR